MALTPIQKRMIKWGMSDDTSRPDIFLARGDYRASKTWGAALVLNMVGQKLLEQRGGASDPDGRDPENAKARFILGGTSIGATQRNVMPAMRDHASMLGLKVLTNWGQNWAWVGGVMFQVYGDTNVESYVPVQGFTQCDGWLLDELQYMRRDFVEMVMSRPDREFAYGMGCFNPSMPNAWVKRDWLDEKQIRHISERALLPDACRAGAVPWSVYHRLNRTLTGHRKLRGLHDTWAAAEGSCWPSFKVAEPISGDWEYVACGADGGVQHPCAAIFAGWDGERWVTISEYFQTGGKTIAQHAAAIAEQGAKLGCTRYAVGPGPLDADLKTHLRRLTGRSVRTWSGHVSQRIDRVEDKLRLGTLVVTKDCPNLERQAMGYVWKDNATKDEPVKIEDDAPDALGYLVDTSRPSFGAV